jgi:uncharacterized membrane protein
MLAVASFCDWLAQTPISLLIQTVDWIIPAVQSVHIMAIAVVMSSAVLIDLRLLRLAGADQPISAVARRFLPWIWCALVVLLVSGSLLIMGEPRRDLLNPVFIAKMALLAATILMTVLFQLKLSRNMIAWDAAAGRNPVPVVFAIASIAFWVAVLACGRWIAYVAHG